MTQTTPKTYKREVAVALLGYYFVMLTLGIWFPEAGEAAEAVKIPAFTFAGGAFAIDAGVKQWGR
jgi:hypothetical protein